VQQSDELVDHNRNQQQKIKPERSEREPDPARHLDMRLCILLVDVPDGSSRVAKKVNNHCSSPGNFLTTENLRENRTDPIQSGNDDNHYDNSDVGDVRVNFEVTTLKPFSYLAFPHLLASEKAPKQPSFDGELMADSRRSYALIQRANANIRKTDGCRDSFRIALGHYPHQCGVKSAADAREQAVLRRQSRRAASLPTSICRSKVTICSGLYLLMAITSSPPDGFSHSTWYKFRRCASSKLHAARTYLESIDFQRADLNSLN
jgi:hypothetical protein